MIHAGAGLENKIGTAILCKMSRYKMVIENLSLGTYYVIWLYNISIISGPEARNELGYLRYMKPCVMRISPAYHGHDELF